MRPTVKVKRFKFSNPKANFQVIKKMEIHLLLQGKYHCPDLQNDLIQELNTSEYKYKKINKTSPAGYIQYPHMIPYWLQSRLYSRIKG